MFCHRDDLVEKLGEEKRFSLDWWIFKECLGGIMWERVETNID